MTDHKKMSQIPLWLLDGQELTSAETAIGMFKRNDYVPISLRDLFLFRRGAKDVSPNACCVVFVVLAERNVRALLPILHDARIPVVLVIEEHLSAKLCDELLGMPYVTVIPVYTKQNHVFSDAVFCQTVDTATLRDLRKNGVRMVITSDKALHGEIPFGIDVLFASVLSASGFPSQGAKQQPHHDGARLLPLDQQPLFSALPLAIPLCILGTDKELLHHTLVSGAWQTSYEPTSDQYCVTADFPALHSVPCAVPQNVCNAFCNYLAGGFYIELQTNAHIHGLGCADRLLLYGFDNVFGTFASQTSLHHGMIERIDILPQTLESICASRGTSVILHTLAENKTTCSTESFVQALQTQKECADGVYYGREAAIRYANRFYKRFADGTEQFSADSLRTFLEERRRYGFAFWYLAKQEDMYLEPFENYLHLLADACKRAIDDLRGKEWLQPEMPLFLTSELMRNLLYTEEFCVTAFLEEWERAEFRRAHLRAFDQK